MVVCVTLGFIHFAFVRQSPYVSSFNCPNNCFEFILSEMSNFNVFFAHG